MGACQNEAVLLNGCKVNRLKN